MGFTKKKKGRETKYSEGLPQLLLNVETVNVKMKCWIKLEASWINENRQTLMGRAFECALK